jgi:hypothetical protein
MKLKIMIMTLLITSGINLSANAKELDFSQYLTMTYSQARDNLINKGWQVVPNQQIKDTSLYAQGIYDQGYQEVVDCISMERDQCQFLLTKNKKLIVVTTKEKALIVESIEAQK